MLVTAELKATVDALLNDYVQAISGKLPASVVQLLVVESTDTTSGVKAPFWIPVLEHGRGPRKDTKNHQLYLKIYKWMEKRNMFNSKSERGKINEAKALTWYINKYGTKLYRDKGFKDVYTAETMKTKELILTEVGQCVRRITTPLVKP